MASFLSNFRITGIIREEFSVCITVIQLKPLFYFILFYFILFYFISFYFISIYFILFYFILFYFILFYFISFYSILFTVCFLYHFVIKYAYIIKYINLHGFLCHILQLYLGHFASNQTEPRFAKRRWYVPGEISANLFHIAAFSKQQLTVYSIAECM